MTPTDAYMLYREFSLGFARYTSDDPLGKRSISPETEVGRTDYNFFGSDGLAQFLNFVIKQRVGGPARLQPEFQRALEESFELKREAVQLLDLIAAEFSSDPMSVQCFDLRIVERTKQVTKRLKELEKQWPM